MASIQATRRGFPTGLYRKREVGMFQRSFCLLLIIFGSVAGCHFRDPSIDLLEGELRWMENQMYLLEGQLEDACVELAECRQDASHESIRSERTPTAADDRSQPWSVLPPPREPTSSRDPNGASRSATEADRTRDSAPSEEASPRQPPQLPRDDFSPPSIEIPDAASDADSGAAPQDTPAGLRPRLRTDSDVTPPQIPAEEGSQPIRLQSYLQDADPHSSGGNNERRDNDGGQDDSGNNDDPLGDGRSTASRDSWQGTPPKRLDAHITHIVTRVARMDSAASRTQVAGIIVRVEPRNADGEFVSLPGDVSVVVLDEARSDATARVARWDLSAEETSRTMDPASATPGLQLQLPWPDKMPEGDALRVYIRYVTVDGRRLESNHPLPAANEHHDASGWQVVDRGAAPAGNWTVVSDPNSGSGAEPAAAWNVLPSAAPAGGSAAAGGAPGRFVPPEQAGPLLPEPASSPRIPSPGTRPAWQPTRPSTKR